MSGLYASGDLGRLLKEANLALNRQETRTVLQVVAGRFMSPTKLTGTEGTARNNATPEFAAVSIAA
jgi:hypothetical protein